MLMTASTEYRNYPVYKEIIFWLVHYRQNQMQNIDYVKEAADWWVLGKVHGPCLDQRKNVGDYYHHFWDLWQAVSSISDHCP